MESLEEFTDPISREFFEKAGQFELNVDIVYVGGVG